MKKEHKFWLAGIVDGEGTISAFWEKPRGYHKETRYLSVYLAVSNTDNRIIQRCKEITGVGCITYCTPKNPKHKKWSSWRVRGHTACKVIRELMPHLISKSEQAAAALEWEGIKKFVGYHKKGTCAVTPEAVAERMSIYSRLRALNKRGR